MLQGEITPYADAHIAKINEFQNELFALIDNTFQGEPTALVTREQLNRWCEDLDKARSALTRFKFCAEDEWKQKERYRSQALNCRLHHIGL